MNARYEYDFIRVKIKGSGLASSFTGKFSEEYQSTIIQQASLGWLLVQCFAPGTAAYGTASYIDLIFEREVAA